MSVKVAKDFGLRQVDEFPFISNKTFMNIKKNILAMLVLSLMVGGAFTAVSVNKAFADSTSPEREVTRSVENTDNGVLITLTTSDADTLTKLQNPPNDRTPPEGVTRVVENIENGVRVTLSSDDAATVTKIQNRAAHKGHPPFFNNKITRSVEEIDNGVLITLTTDDADALAKLKEREAKAPTRDEVTRTVEELNNGFKITLTSEDAAVVDKLQNPDLGGHGFGFGPKHHGLDK